MCISNLFFLIVCFASIFSNPSIKRDSKVNRNETLLGCGVFFSFFVSFSINSTFFCSFENKNHFMALNDIRNARKPVRKPAVSTTFGLRLPSRTETQTSPNNTKLDNLKKPFKNTSNGFKSPEPVRPVWSFFTSLSASRNTQSSRVLIYISLAGICVFFLLLWKFFDKNSNPASGAMIPRRC